jgi:N-acetylmuramoyl-L-alanine amidase
MKIINLIGHLTVSSRLRYAKRHELDIKRIVIHHSGTKTGTPEAFARYHVQKCGWPGIAYHYVIAKAGTIWKCNLLTNITYHARGANVDSVGIRLVGDFTKDDPTGAQIESLRWLVGELNRNLLSNKVKVVLHRDIKGSKTDCPGKYFPINWRTM